MLGSMQGSEDLGQGWFQDCVVKAGTPLDDVPWQGFKPLQNKLAGYQRVHLCP